jgi:hypothetical protein
MARRRRRGHRTGAGVGLAVAGVAAIGTIATAFLAGLITGAGCVLAAVRPRLSLRVSTRGTRGRTLGRGRP